MDIFEYLETENSKVVFRFKNETFKLPHINQAGFKWLNVKRHSHGLLKADRILYDLEEKETADRLASTLTAKEYYSFFLAWVEACNIKEQSITALIYGLALHPEELEYDLRMFTGIKGVKELLTLNLFEMTANVSRLLADPDTFLWNSSLGRSIRLTTTSNLVADIYDLWQRVLESKSYKTSKDGKQVGDPQYKAVLHHRYAPELQNQSDIPTGEELEQSKEVLMALMTGEIPEDKVYILTPIGEKADIK